jgi:hypothetical protein
MTRIMLLIGSLAILAAGTASAQTSVSGSIGFGVPRPYLAGTVFVGRPHLRPMYRPYLHRFPHRRAFVPRFHAYRPLLVVPCPRGFHRPRGFVGRRVDRD